MSDELVQKTQVADKESGDLRSSVVERLKLDILDSDYAKNLHEEIYYWGYLNFDDLSGEDMTEKKGENEIRHLESRAIADIEKTLDPSFGSLMHDPDTGKRLTIYLANDERYPELDENQRRTQLGTGRVI